MTTVFDKNRYMTRGVDETIPFELQLFMWGSIASVPELDYLQIFKLEPMGTMQRITHEQEQPPFKREYLVPTDNPITAKVYVIDSINYSTMLLAEEY